MDVQVINCIKQYINKNYHGGLIKVADISAYCQCSEGKIISGLVELENLGEGKIEKRYSCPACHTVREDEVPFCSECDYEYPQQQINVYLYFKPLVTARK